MSPLLTIDVAHPPRKSDVVERELLEAWTTVRNSSTLRVLKVIHGHGSTGKGGITRDVVRNWAFLHRKHFKAVIEGERYELYNPDVQEMRLVVGQYNDTDLQQANPGITVLWIR